MPRRPPFALGFLVALVLALAGARALAAQSAPPSPTLPCAGSAPFAEVQIDGSPRVSLDLARTPAEREVGLMFRSSLPDDAGMLFVYDQQATEGYWMFNTLIPLSIAWIARDGTIVDIQDMPRLDDPSDAQEAARHVYTPSGPYWYALEVNEGWYVQHGVGVGQQVRFCLDPAVAASPG